MSGIRFTDEFKRDAVAQVVDRGYSVAEVSERLGTPLTGRRFVKQICREGAPSLCTHGRRSFRSRANRSTRLQNRPRRSDA